MNWDVFTVETLEMKEEQQYQYIKNPTGNCHITITSPCTSNKPVMGEHSAAAGYLFCKQHFCLHGRHFRDLHPVS